MMHLSARSRPDDSALPLMEPVLPGTHSLTFRHGDTSGLFYEYTIENGATVIYAL